MHHRWDQRYLLEQFDGQVRAFPWKPPYPHTHDTHSPPIPDPASTTALPPSLPPSLPPLRAQGLEELKRAYSLSDDILHAYQRTFMELDLSCRGFLELDALRVIIVMKGEDLDDEQLQEIFDEYDTEGGCGHALYLGLYLSLSGPYLCSPRARWVLSCSRRHRARAPLGD